MNIKYKKQAIKRRFSSYQLEHGLGFKNMYPIHADTSDPHTVIHGMIKRLFKDTEITPVRKLLTEFRKFVWNYMRIHFDPIPETAKIDLESWLLRTSYTELEKENLRSTWREVFEQFPDMKVSDDQWLEHFYIDAFPKEEEFEEMKECRGIYARSDVGKCYFGPFAKLMEDIIYYTDKKPSIIEFAKKIKPDQLISWLETEMSEYQTYIQTDFSSFEGSFSPIFMRSCELVMYSFLLQNYRNVYQTFKKLAGTNLIHTKFFTATIKGCRMSGEMTTSLSNGFSNKMIHLFLAHKHGYKLAKGIVEGDDGVFAFRGKDVPSEKNYSDLGFKIKIEVKRHLWDTKFCSVVFEQLSRSKIYNPTEFLMRLNWSCNPKASTLKAGRRRKLLVLKCLSYLAQFPNCPVISPICYGLLSKINIKIDKKFAESIWRLEKSTRYKLLNIGIDIEKLLSTVVRQPEVNNSTRIRMQEVFGFTIAQQLYAEKHYFDGNAIWPYNLVQNDGVVVYSKTIQPDYLMPRRVQLKSVVVNSKGKILKL